MTAPAANAALNAICPYFTLFPLKFPLRILQGRAKQHRAVLDPFCGRGTTNFAARLPGLRSLGVDSSPVAAAIAEARLAWPGSLPSIARASRSCPLAAAAPAARPEKRSIETLDREARSGDPAVDRRPNLGTVGGCGMQATMPHLRDNR